MSLIFRLSFATSKEDRLTTFVSTALSYYFEYLPRPAYLKAGPKFDLLLMSVHPFPFSGSALSKSPRNA